MSKIIPELSVSNMAASVDFYHALGFVSKDSGIVDDQGSQWESLQLDNMDLWLIRQDVSNNIGPDGRHGSGLTLFAGVDDVDRLYNAVKAGPLQSHITGEIETLWYGLREFKLRDPDGYIWTFNMPVDVEQSAIQPGDVPIQGQEAQALPDTAATSAASSAVVPSVMADTHTHTPNPLSSLVASSRRAEDTGGIAVDQERPGPFGYRDDRRDVAHSADSGNIEPRLDVDQIQPGQSDYTSGAPTYTTSDVDQIQPGEHGYTSGIPAPATREEGRAVDATGRDARTVDEGVDTATALEADAPDAGAPVADSEATQILPVQTEGVQGYESTAANPADAAIPTEMRQEPARTTNTEGRFEPYVPPADDRTSRS